MKPRLSVTTKRLNRQLAALKADLVKTMPAELATAARDVHKQIKENVSGTEEMLGKQAKAHPSAMSAKLPVQLISGLLKSAQKIVRENKWTWKLFSDHSIADYDIFVEYGTFKMFPRFFHQGAILQAKRKLQRRWSLLIEGKIQRHGRR